SSHRSPERRVQRRGRDTARPFLDQAYIMTCDGCRTSRGLYPSSAAVLLSRPPKRDSRARGANHARAPHRNRTVEGTAAVSPFGVSLPHTVQPTMQGTGLL